MPSFLTDVSVCDSEGRADCNGAEQDWKEREGSSNTWTEFRKANNLVDHRALWRMSPRHCAGWSRTVQKLVKVRNSKSAARFDGWNGYAMLEYAAARRGLFLTVHALNKAKEVLNWELLGDRETALDVTMHAPVQKNTASFPKT
jgi:hypothetical protein